MAKCYKGGTQHKFKPRMDEYPNAELLKRATRVKGYNRSILYYKVYVHDICVWCGKTIKREV